MDLIRHAFTPVVAVGSTSPTPPAAAAASTSADVASVALSCKARSLSVTLTPSLDMCDAINHLKAWLNIVSNLNKCAVLS
jgi:hypothetical protein